MDNKRHYRIAVLPGDGIGPEVMTEAIKVLEAVKNKFSFSLDLSLFAIGGDAIDRFASPLPEATEKACQSADAVLLGSIGGPRWDRLPPEQRPEIGGLLALRKKLHLYANLRPVRLLRTLKHISPLALRDLEGNIDLITVRELSSGIYFGEPKFLGSDEALDTMRYRKKEIERISHSAFTIARRRRRLVTSVDKANVLRTSMLWRQTVENVAMFYPDVELRHMYVDNAAMQLIIHPMQFDVILTENLFGDILSDESAALCGSLGMLPSASLGDTVNLFEPAGGSAPDIAGKGIANPVAQILSAAMMLEYSFGEHVAASAIESAVIRVIQDGIRTRDISAKGAEAATTAQMGDAIVSAITR